MADLLIRIGAEAGNVAVVRETLEALLRRGHASAELIADVKATVTEACMNVVRYAYHQEQGVIEVAARAGDDQLLVAVRDYGSGIAANAGDPSGAGLGLPLIDALADQVEVDSDPGRGTDVRIRFRIGTARPAPAADAALRRAVAQSAGRAG